MVTGEKKAGEGKKGKKGRNRRKGDKRAYSMDHYEWSKQGLID